MKLDHSTPELIYATYDLTDMLYLLFIEHDRVKEEGYSVFNAILGAQMPKSKEIAEVESEDIYVTVGEDLSEHALNILEKHFPRRQAERFARMCTDLPSIMYMNFPVQLLKGFLLDSTKVLKNIRDYAFYVYSMDMEFESKTEAMEFSRKYFNIDIDDPKESWDNGRHLHEINKESPVTGLNTTLYLLYLNNEKSNFEKVCLLAHLALKSIIQNKTYVKLDNLYLFSRMDGNSKSIDDENSLSNELRPYFKRYQRDKIIKELRDSWGLSYYSKRNRGFYISFKLGEKKLGKLISKKNV